LILGSIVSGTLTLALASQACREAVELPPPTAADAGPTEAGPADAGGPGISLGTVTFRMTAAANASSYTYASSDGDPGDGIWWYSVTTADGGYVMIFVPGAGTTCDTCNNMGIPVGYSCYTLPDAGITATWDGISYPGSSTCGGGTQCAIRKYVSEGEYVVHMCAGCDFTVTDAGPDCVNVPFHYPTSAEIVGTL
jgi:hypothetical protein